MKSYNQSHDRTNLIKTILYLLKVNFFLIICHLTYLTFLINLPNQLFESTYAINPFNQPTIESDIPLAYGLLFSQIYIHKRVYSYLLNTYNLCGLFSCRSLTHQVVISIILEYSWL